MIFQTKTIVRVSIVAGIASVIAVCMETFLLLPDQEIFHDPASASEPSGVPAIPATKPGVPPQAIPSMHAIGVGGASGTPSIATASLPLATDDPRRGILLDSGAGDTSRNSAIDDLYAVRDPHLVEDLIAIVHRRDERPRFRAFVAQHLGVIVCDGAADLMDRETAQAELLALLDDTERAVRREALRSLSIIDHPVALEMLEGGLVSDAWLQDRDLIIECLFEKNRRDKIQEIRTFIQDPDPVVRIASIHVLGEWSDRESRAGFLLAAASDNARLRRAGNRALERLDGNRKAP
jgi:hypothetical protein